MAVANDGPRFLREFASSVEEVCRVEQIPNPHPVAFRNASLPALFSIVLRGRIVADARCDGGCATALFPRETVGTD